MIVDCHTHVWESLDQLGRGTGMWQARARRAGLAGPPKASRDDHLAACEPVDKSIVLAFKSHYLAADVPNEYVSAYVRKNADRLIGFAAVDPTRPVEVAYFVPPAGQNDVKPSQRGVLDNQTQVWGVVVDEATGLIYASDMNTGLWILRRADD